MPSIIQDFAGYVHPCGAISVGLIPKQSKSADERRAEAANRKLNTPDGTDLADCLTRQLQAGQITIGQAVDALSELGLSSLPNSRNQELTSNHQADLPSLPSGLEKPKKDYGRNGITSKGRLRVRDGATILENKYGRRALTFATVTLPAMPDNCLQEICQQWGNYVNRLVEEIKRELARHNAPLEIIYCTEIQENRYKTYGQIAPHLHLLWYAYERDIHGASIGRYAISADKLREINQRVINRIIPDYQINVSASVDVQKVKKSAANYLGKYMSKGGKVVEQIKKDGNADQLPRSWWGVTKELRQEIIKSIIKVTGNIAKNLFYHTEKLEKMGIINRWGKVTVSRNYCDSNSEEKDIAYITYGIYAQLSPKLQGQNPLFMGILDICDMLDDDCIDDICGWIGAMCNADMVQDMCNWVLELKELLLENNQDGILIDSDTGEILLVNVDSVYKM